jgi:hypothetical protein
MNRTLAISGGIALFALGLAAGLFLRRSGPEPGTRPPAQARQLEQAPDGRPGQSAPADVTRLEARVRELEAEVQNSRGTPAKAGATAAPAALAEEIFKSFLELGDGANPDPDKARALFAKLGQLDETMAGYFIEQFRKSAGPDLEDERQTAMELALACGGPAVAEFVNVLLNDASLEPELRSELLGELSGARGGLFSIRRLPISEALASTAMTLCRSTESEDRQGGAGLLGGVKSEVSRTELRRLIVEDKDVAVRTSAILALGHVGDQASRTFLERLWTAPESLGLTRQAAANVRSAIESATRELAER